MSHKNSEFIIYPQLKILIDDFVALRKQKGITQEELSYRIGVGERYVSMWECGLRKPKLFNLLCWAEALDGRLRLISEDSEEIKSMAIANDNRLKEVA